MAKKVFNIISKVATWTIIAFAIVVVVFTLITVTTVDKDDRNVFGYRFFIVLSDSMSESEENAHMKVHFNAGDIVISKDVPDITTLKEGDIISFKCWYTYEDGTPHEFYSQTITHMIKEILKNDEGEIIGFKTFGIKSGNQDPWTVYPEWLMGEYQVDIPGVGWAFNFIKSTPGYIIFILVPFLILILYNIINIIVLFRKYRKEQLAKMQEERDKIDAERAENQRMMQELLALKAQLDQKNKEASSGDGNSDDKPGDAE